MLEDTVSNNNKYRRRKKRIKEHLFEVFKNEIMPSWGEETIPPYYWLAKNHYSFIREMHSIDLRYKNFIKEVKRKEVKKHNSSDTSIERLINYFDNNVLPNLNGQYKFTKRELKRNHREFISMLKREGVNYYEFKEIIRLYEKGTPIENIIEVYEIRKENYKKLNNLEECVKFYKENIDPGWKNRKRALTTDKIMEKGYGWFIRKLKNMSYTYTKFIVDGLGLKPNKTTTNYKELETLNDFVEFYTKEIDPEWKDRGKALSTTKIKEKGYTGFLTRLRRKGYNYNRFVEEGLGIEPNNCKKTKNDNKVSIMIRSNYYKSKDNRKEGIDALCQN